MTAVRCDWSDLLVDECGHCTGAETRAKGPKPIAFEGTWRSAHQNGTCWCGCGERIQPGDDIVLARFMENGEERAHWCLLEHTRPEGSTCH